MTPQSQNPQTLGAQTVPLKEAGALCLWWRSDHIPSGAGPLLHPSVECSDLFDPEVGPQFCPLGDQTQGIGALWTLSAVRSRTQTRY